MTNSTFGDSAAQLGATHGYRFEGDFVHINADLLFSEADLASGNTWALQLWASDSGFSGAELAGVKVAELAIQAMPGLLSVAGSSHAMPPAGVADQVLGLALVAYDANGQSEVVDFGIYAERETFPQPRLLGDVSCCLTDGEALLSIASITNPRDADNLSGTLSLEVWALDEPYVGGSWTGIPVASLVLGILAGGDEWSACEFAVPAAIPDALMSDAAVLTVMLREWTPAGYLTRDYRNIAVAAAKVEELTSEKPASEAVLPVVASMPAAPANAGKVATAKAKKATKAAPAAVQPVKKADKPTKSKPVPNLISINKASEAELQAIKGLSSAVARAIIAARPFVSLDDLCRAKGMGPKMLDKLRDKLAL